MDEDCLTLNVWTPAKDTNERLPVYFWIYGGGLQWGNSAEMEFDGDVVSPENFIEYFEFCLLKIKEEGVSYLGLK